MYKNAMMPAVGENGGVHRVSGYHMGYRVDGVAPSTGAGAHGGRLPIDVGGANTGKSRVYAGNDLLCLGCGSQAQGVYFYTTREPVALVSGEICYVLLECIHMTAADRTACGLGAGKAIAAGGWMYSEGTAGGASMHLHIDLGRAQTMPATGKSPWHSIGGGSYAPNDNYPINRALFMPAAMTVYQGTELAGGNVRDNVGYIWHRDTGETPIGEVRIGDSAYNRRTGPGTDKPVVSWAEHESEDNLVLAGRLYTLYETRDGWLRITQRGVGGADGTWIAKEAGTVKLYEGTGTDAVGGTVQSAEKDGRLQHFSVTFGSRETAMAYAGKMFDLALPLEGTASEGDAAALWALALDGGGKYHSEYVEGEV